MLLAEINVPQDMNFSRSEVVLFSVIIPAHNRAEYLGDAVLSVCEQTIPPEEYEVIVVDNGSTDETRKVVESIASEHSIVRYIYESRIGLHNARHAGARESTGEILVYIDEDVIVPPGWLQAMAKPFAKSEVACVGGRILPQWEAQPPTWLDQFGRNGGINLSMLDLGDDALELAWPQTVYGCNMSVRKGVLYEIGGFNPDAIGDRHLIWLRGDGETGLHEKIYHAGYKVIYEPLAWLHHRVPASRLEPSYFFWRSFIQGISDSYTHMRRNRLTVVQLLWHAGGCIMGAVRSYATSVGASQRRIYWRSKAWYWYGRAQHQLRLSLSQSLRHHVLQENYLQ